VAEAFELVQFLLLAEARPSVRAAWVMRHEEFVPLLAQEHALPETLLMVGQRMAPESTMHCEEYEVCIPLQGAIAALQRYHLDGSLSARPGAKPPTLFVTKFLHSFVIVLTSY
jgi:hypothetical protein